jgi:O-antigen/teichoic acid export membrane protein
LRLAGNLLLTRLLLPEAFGLMAVITTVLFMLMLFSDIGSNTVIVQSEGGTDQQLLDTAWTLQIIRGFGLWIAATLVALGIWLGQRWDLFATGTVYDDARLPMLIFVAGFVSVLNGFASVKAILAERHLDFAAVAAIEVGANVLSLAATAAAAYLTGSVWALVGGYLVTSVIKLAAGHLVLKGPRCSLRLHRESLRELFSKGKWIVASSVLGLLALSGDKLLLGGLVDSATLGLYSIAFGLASIVSSAMSAVLGRVVFPIFSEVVRQRPEELQRTYERLQQVVDVGVGLLAGFVFLASPLVVDALYDNRYQGVAHILSTLAIGSLGIRFVVAEQMYLAMGNPSLLALAGLPRALIVLVGVPLGYAINQLDGALVAVVLSQFSHWPVAIWFRTKHRLNSWRNDIILPMSTLAGLLVGWGAMVAAGYAVRS